MCNASAQKNLRRDSIPIGRRFPSPFPPFSIFLQVFFLQKKFWIAWSKFRFLRLPVERRVRLEVTTDGRHITFLLVSLHEAGYGVQVVGSPAMFRELICLRKSEPIPFVVGGKEYEVGISITDQPSTLDAGRSSLFVLDYDYFSGLNNAGVSHGGTANTEVGEDLGKNESRENFNPGLHEYARIEAEQSGQRLAGQAGAEFSNPFTIELARDSENTSFTRSANNPASSVEQPRTDIGGLISDKSEVAKALDSGLWTLDADRRPNAGHSLKEWSGVFEGLSPSSLGSMPSKTPPARAPGVPALASSSVLIREIRGQNASSPATSHSPLATALRAPYFMHPSVYHRGLHKRRSPSTALDSAAKRRRRFRLGFFGTHDREFYTKHYHFPGMNRFEILEVFLQKFGNRMRRLRGFPRDWDGCEIAVSIDSRGGDRRGKSFLSQDHYFEALRECDFVLSPPGWCMPLSHNLVEAMICGAIPIINSGAFMAPPLENGANCLEFFGEVDFIATIEKALVLSDLEVEQMRAAVLEHYDRFLEPKAFVEELVSNESGRAFVNAEENSVRLVFPGMLFPWNVTAEARGII